MLRNRRELTTDEVDQVVDTIAATAAELRDEAAKVAGQRLRMAGIAERLEGLVTRLQESERDA